jgi:prephenate dehydrogenase
METLLVGAGSMGRWAGGVLAEMGATLAVFDTDLAAAREAATALDGRVADPAPDDRFETVCIAVPIPAAPGAIATHGPRATEFVFDVAGTMSGPVEALAGLGTAERASVHPLFAPENEPGNVPLVVDADGPHLQRFRDTLEARGNHVFETTPDEHDRAMDTVQARTHAAVLAYGLAAEPVPDRFHTPLSASLSELVADVTDGVCTPISRPPSTVQRRLRRPPTVSPLPTPISSHDCTAMRHRTSVILSKEVNMISSHEGNNTVLGGHRFPIG